MTDTLNIVVVGKSGVGKSSFLNYLLGKEVFKTGIGEPVTQGYFDKREMPANEQGVKYVLYDTKGIEPTTTSECRDNIFREIDNRDKHQSFFEWIHSVYYCFDSTSARIEPLEYNFINELTKKVSVIVLLTKSDTITNDRIENLSKQIRLMTSPSILVIPVCSIESKGTRKNPTPVHQFGREEVLKASFYGLWNKVSTIIPNKSVESVQNIISKLSPKALTYLEYNSKQREKEFRKYCYDEEPNRNHLNQIKKELLKMSVNPSKEVYDKVVEFYKKVNRFSPQLLFLTESQNVFNELRQYDPASDISQINRALVYIENALHELNQCVIWSDAEKKVLKKEIEHYKECISDIKKRLQTKVDRFVSTYKGELLQYGRLCISNEKIESSVFNDISDLSKDESLYAKMIKFALSTGHVISHDERQLLDNLRQELQISETKAGRIEDYLRNL